MEQHSDVDSSRCEGRRASGFHKLQRMYLNLIACIIYYEFNNQKGIF